MFVKITRVHGETDRALIFRGWSRLCLHAATLSAAEGASAAAMALSRAARAEAMDNEAEEAAAKAEAWRRAAAANVEATEARNKAQGGYDDLSTLNSELKQKGEGTDLLLQEQQLRRMKMLVSMKQVACATLNLFQELSCQRKAG